MTPCGRSRGQPRSSWASSAAIAAPSPGCTASARAAAVSNSGRQPSTESALRARHREVGAGEMQLRQRLARPRAQWAALGRRIHMPSRKVTIAAGRPASRPSASPLRLLHRLRAGEAARRQMLHQAEEERQVARRHALLVERQDEVAAAGCAAGSSSSRRLRRCPCRRAARRDRSRRGNAGSSSSVTSV